MKNDIVIDIPKKTYISVRLKKHIIRLFVTDNPFNHKEITFISSAIPKDILKILFGELYVTCNNDYYIPYGVIKIIINSELIDIIEKQDDNIIHNINSSDLNNKII